MNARTKTRPHFGELREDAVYLSPSGRACRWMPMAAQSYHTFVYLDNAIRPRHAEAANWHEGFHLTAANLRLLRVLHNGGGAR